MHNRFTFDIEFIIANAYKEQELEQQFLTIEEKWSEQVNNSCYGNAILLTIIIIINETALDTSDSILKHFNCQSFFVLLSFTIQVLKFESHSHTSIPLLSQSYSFSLLEQLDSTQTDLAVMLMSKHIHPLRNDCAQWAGKLEHIAEVLQVHVHVQLNMYMYTQLHIHVVYIIHNYYYLNW